MSHNTEEWCSVWRNTDSWFQKWHEEFIEINSEVIFYVLNDNFLQYISITFWSAFDSDLQTDFYYVHDDVDVFFFFFFNKTLTSLTCFFAYCFFLLAFLRSFSFFHNVCLTFFIYRKKIFIFVICFKKLILWYVYF